MIVAALMVTVAWSVFSRKGKTLTLIKNVRRHAQQYLDLEYHGHPKPARRPIVVSWSRRERCYAYPRNSSH